MTSVEVKDLNQPDQVTEFENAKISIVQIAGSSVGRGVMQPGWRWSKHVKPIVKTDLCQVLHFGYVISGRPHIRMADGHEFEDGPGQVSVVPPGHDGRVVGDEPYVGIEWSGNAASFGRTA